MEKLGGFWSGEYSINNGTEDNPDIKYFAFKVKINEQDESFKGSFIDQTIKSENSQINGFIEDDFISFIRLAQQNNELLDFLDIDIEDVNRPLEFIFNGNWNSEAELFEGVWEIQRGEEDDGFQEDVMVEYRTGAWYLTRI